MKLASPSDKGGKYITLRTSTNKNNFLTFRWLLLHVFDKVVVAECSNHLCVTVVPQR
jgi:hypothetical protein